MTFAERLQGWNTWYDGLPEEWRFQVILWPLILVGAINMALTVSVGFPFALLVMIAIIALTVVRVPFVLGWVRSTAQGTPAETAPGVRDASATSRISIAAVPWVYDLNLWYDGLPESRRPWVILAVLGVAGGINMLLTIHSGFSFGILFLLALLLIVVIRGPYVAGWLIPPARRRDQIAAAGPQGQIAQEQVVQEQIGQEHAMAAPMHLPVAEPASATHEAHIVEPPHTVGDTPVTHQPPPSDDRPN